MTRATNKASPQESGQEIGQDLPGPPPLPPHFLGCQPYNFVPFGHVGRGTSQKKRGNSMRVPRETSELQNTIQREAVKDNTPTTDPISPQESNQTKEIQAVTAQQVPDIVSNMVQKHVRISREH
jgi:hypothetical protein